MTRLPTDKAKGGPTTIDHYRVEKRLAVGTMGEIYLAYEPGLDRRVALKFLSQDFCSNPKNVERFVREAKASADLQHTNIVSVYYSGEHKGRPYFAMEWVDGESLAETAIRGPLETVVAVEYMIQAARGLDAAWKKGIIHRDVKPANLMLNKRGNIKVADFGLAKSIGRDTELTSTDIVVGTPDFIAPEQAQGEPCDCRADIYALGASFYFLLTGTVPFPGPNNAAVLVKHITEPPPNVIDRRPECPRNLSRTIKKMMSKSPKDRFQTYGELITHLEKLKDRMISGLEDPTSESQVKMSAIRPSRHMKKASVDSGVSLLKVFFYCFILLAVTLLGIHIWAPPWWPFSGFGAARVICTTKPPGAMIYVDGKFINREADGETAFTVRSGERTFEFKLPLYKSRTVVVDVGAGRENEVGPVTLEANWGKLRTTGTPKDTEIKIRSFSDPNAEVRMARIGSVVSKLEAGKYVVEAEDGRSEPQKKSVEILGDGSTVELTFNLKPLTTAVHISSAPEGANITWDGKDLSRETPYDMSSVPMGKHILRMDLQKNGRQLFYEGEVDVGPGEPFKIERPLVPWTIPVNFKSTPTGALVEQLVPKVELKSIGFATKLTKRLEPGDYEFLFSHTGYRSVKKKVKLAGAGPVEVSATLIKESGAIVFDISPKGAIITLNGKTVPPDKQMRCPVVPDSYTIVVSKEKHYAVTKVITVNDNETQKVSIQLRQLIPGPELGENFMNSIGMEMTWINPGNFVMGSPLRERGRQPNEGPQHEVVINRPFWMGTFEVTQDEYKAVTGKNPSKFKGERKPVDSISWSNAKTFCEELTMLERQNKKLGPGQVYRLPSETEWEYCCRAGTKTAFSFGDSLSSVEANFDGNYPYGTARRGRYRQRTTTVGLFKPNAFGLYDMHGNVFEWCQDVWHDSYKGKRDGARAWIEGTDENRVARGGSWGTNGESCRSARRTRSNPEKAFHSYGIRVVLTLPEGVSWRKR